MSKHTPGPWSAMAPEDGSLVCVMAKLRPRHGQEVIGWFEDDLVSKRETFANATLAAAAPRMLAALERVVALHNGGPNGVGNWDAAFDECAAAATEARSV